MKLKNAFLHVFSVYATNFVNLNTYWLVVDLCAIIFYEYPHNMYDVYGMWIATGRMLTALSIHSIFNIL